MPKFSCQLVSADGAMREQNKCVLKCLTYRGGDRKNVTGTVKVFTKDEKR